MIVLVNGLQAANRSGTGRYTTGIVQGLAQRPEIECHVLWPETEPGLDGQLSPSQVHKVRINPAWRRIWLDQFGFRRYARASQSELVHYPANIGPARSPIPVVLTIHDLTFFRNPEWFSRNRALYYQAAVAHTAPRAARVIADSTATKQDITQYLRYPEDRIDVIPLGVDSQFRPAPEEEQKRVMEKYQLPGDFLLFAGTIEPRKNLPRLIEAFEHVADELPADMVIAGRDGWKSGMTYRMHTDSPHRRRIHLPGFISPEDLPAVLSAAWAFVWPSLGEGFGLPPLEAMACGTPVLTSNTSSLPEVTGDSALLVDPENLEAIVDGLRRIATDEDLRVTLTTKGLERAATFTWENTARILVDSYQRALSG